MAESPQFPVPPRIFDGASRTVDAGASFDWLRQGWALFVAEVGVWIVCTVLFLLIYFGPLVVGTIGQIASNLFLPLLTAGLFHLCRQQSEGAKPEIADLFVGFKRQTGPLVVVGIIYTLAFFVIVLVAMLVVGGSIAGGVAAGSPAGIGMALGGILLASLLALVLFVPVIMAMWFAPALVFFKAMPPVEAMKASFMACLKNWLAFSVYGVILFVLMTLATLLMGLGLLVLIPVLAGAQYASYRDIFLGV